LKKLLFIIVACLFTVSGFAKDPDQIIKNLQKKFAEVKDYEADVKVKVDVDLLKVPESNSRIYFKQPDKVKIKSESFSLIPKDGVNFLPKLFAKKEYTSIYVREEMLNGIKTTVIKLIPLNESGDVLLSTLWVDEAKSVIRKAEVSTKLNGTFNIDMNYNYVDSYYMISSLKFSFDLNNINIPKNPEGDQQNDKPKKNKIKKATKGNVYITYSNYKVNKGIPDSIFEEKKK